MRSKRATQSSLAVDIDVPPQMITAKITPDDDLHCVAGGDWDVERRVNLEHSAKHRAIREHFVDGVPWLETDLFKINYAQRLREGPVKNHTSLRDLAALYDRQIKDLYCSMAREGFDGTAKNLPKVVIGRTGEIMLTNQGNHRIAIAKILGVATVKCQVQCRHLGWLEERLQHPEHPDGSA